MNVFNTLSIYFSYPFVRSALLVGVLVSLCSSLLGVTVVLKRFSFIGDGLSHVAFGAMAIAGVLHISRQMIIVLPVTLTSAILLLKTGRKAKIKGDATLAMLSVLAMAAGYLLMNVFSVSSNISGDVCSSLFGSYNILTLSSLDIWISISMSVIVVLFFTLFYNKIFSVTFDETFAKATGTNTSLYNFFLAVIIALVIVLAMNLVGSLLVSALVIFPALTAMRRFKSFKGVTIAAAVIAVLSSALGIILSILLETPTGCTIVLVFAAVFIIFWLSEKIKG